MRTLVAATTLFFGMLSYAQAVELTFEFAGFFDSAQTVPPGYDPDTDPAPGNIVVVTDTVTGDQTAVFGAFTYTVAGELTSVGSNGGISGDNLTAELNFSQFPDTVFVVEGISLLFDAPFRAPVSGSADPTEYIEVASLQTLFHTDAPIILFTQPGVPDPFGPIDDILISSLDMIPDGFTPINRTDETGDNLGIANFGPLLANDGQFTIHTIFPDYPGDTDLIRISQNASTAVPAPSAGILLLFGALLLRRKK